MERYRTRTGVVLTSVCGEYFLVAAKALRDVCPYVTSVNESTAFLWQQLLGGATQEELEASVLEEYDIDDAAAIRGVIADFLQQMRELNYICMENTEEQHEE